MSTEHKEARDIVRLKMEIELRLNDVDIKFRFDDLSLASPDIATIADVNSFVSNAIQEIIATSVSARNVFYDREKQLIERAETFKKEVSEADKDECLQESLGEVAKERVDRSLDEVLDILRQEE